MSTQINISLDKLTFSNKIEFKPFHIMNVPIHIAASVLYWKYLINFINSICNSDYRC